MVPNMFKSGELLINISFLYQADDNFWKVKYNHEAAKQARVAKRTERKAAKVGTSRKKKPSASDLLKLDDTSDDEEEEDTGNSQAVDEEQQQFESWRHTQNSNDVELSSGLPDVTRKCRTEVISDLRCHFPLAGLFHQPLNSSDSNYQDTSPSSGESMQSNMPAFKTAPGMQVKPSKKAKKSKSSQDPVVTEPELGATAPDSSTHQPPPEPTHDIPAPTYDPPTEDTLNNSDNPKAPSPVKTTDPDVEILKTHFVEPGRPTVLAKCSAKEELLERQKAKLDIADYTHLSIGDIVSGYLNQVHSSRDLEIGMVSKYSKNLRYDLCL
ncbi:uncharacterized protein [Triticum aestivum]|uniref:uncharacterized protein n=1 Tax=Triticum aestivum TaxID=4565 RepID=UPI001D033652|nr:uncharacterized protein LOC123064189 [Triticum aestivum]